MSVNGSAPVRTIAVINWERFQHYKDRDPPWIKLYRDMLTSEPWVLGTDTSRLVQIAITLLAARYSNAIPYNFAMLKKVASFDFNEKQFRLAIDYLVSVNFIEVQELTRAVNGLAQDASTTLPTCNTETEQRESRAEQRERPTARRTAPDVPPEFADFKFFYPPRAGDQGWGKALRAAKARLTEGHTWIEIIDGAKRYASYVKATGSEGTPYVKQAATFLGPDLCFLERWELPKTKAETHRDTNLENTAEWVHARQ